MAKCTKCNKKVSYLVATYLVEYRSKFNPRSKPKQFTSEKLTGLTSRQRYSCPECEALLFTNHEKASEFMQ